MISFEPWSLFAVGTSTASNSDLFFSFLLLFLFIFVYSPYNPWRGSRFETSPDEAVKQFADILQKEDSSLKVTIRWPRGRDISVCDVDDCVLFLFLFVCCLLFVFCCWFAVFVAYPP